MAHESAPSAQAIRLVAERLGNLCSKTVFVGGSVVPLLATDLAALDFRPTKDVDLVTHVATRVEYGRFEEELRQRGFANDTSPGAPVCRWRVGEIVVDAMPKNPEAIGFSNPWYPAALDSAWELTFQDGPTVRIISSPAFIATKWEAYRDRGRGDHLGSHDLEDILTVVNARPETVRDVREAAPDLRDAVAQSAAVLLSNARFTDDLPGLVEPGRERVVLDRLRQIAALGGA